MRLIGFSRQKSKAEIFVDNKENISRVFTGNLKYINWVKDISYEAYTGPMPFFVMHFSTDFNLYTTASSVCLVVKEKDIDVSYDVYSEGITQFFKLLDSNKILKDPDGFYIGVFSVVKSGNTVSLSLLDPDNLNMESI
jgi:hypothetical protein